MASLPHVSCFALVLAVTFLAGCGEDGGDAAISYPEGDQTVVEVLLTAC